MVSSTEKQKIVSALCKHLDLDPANLAVDSGIDLKSLYTSIIKSSLKGDALGNDNELMKWVEASESFVENPCDAVNGLTKLNEDLLTKSVVLGNGLKPSAADIVLFSAVHPYLIGLQQLNRGKLPHLFRWAEYIQNKEDLGDLFEKIVIEKAPPVIPKVDNFKLKKSVQDGEQDIRTEAGPKVKKNADKKNNVEVSTQEATDKKKLPEKEEKKAVDISVSLLKIQIGLIRKAWKHPSADSLLVEEIDIGESKCRQVVSGLAKYCSPEELTNRYVVLITNVKPGKLRDVMSEGLVLCASNTDHTVVEPLRAPEGAKVGECITFSGHAGKPEDVLNPKKKQLDKITPHLFTDNQGVATFEGVPFMTSSGPCTSLIPNASIK